MNVTKCDCCGAIVGNDEAYKIDVTRLKTKNNKVDRVCRLEICIGCKRRVLSTLDMSEVQDEG
jgi:hypothetical protein